MSVTVQEQRPAQKRGPGGLWGKIKAPGWYRVAVMVPAGFGFATGLDVLIRGLTLTSDSDHVTLTLTDRLFDGLYEHIRRHLLTGRPPA